MAMCLVTLTCSLEQAKDCTKMRSETAKKKKGPASNTTGRRGFKYTACQNIFFAMNYVSSMLMQHDLLISLCKQNEPKRRFWALRNHKSIDFWWACFLHFVWPASRNHPARKFVFMGIQLLLLLFFLNIYHIFNEWWCPSLPIQCSHNVNVPYHIMKQRQWIDCAISPKLLTIWISRLNIWIFHGMFLLHTFCVGDLNMFLHFCGLVVVLLSRDLTGIEYSFIVMSKKTRVLEWIYIALRYNQIWTVSSIRFKMRRFKHDMTFNF